MDDRPIGERHGDLMKIPEGPGVRKLRAAIEARLADTAGRIGLPTPGLDREGAAHGTQHLAGMLAALHVDRPLASPRLRDALLRAVEAAAAMDLVIAENVALQTFLPKSPDHMLEDHKVIVLVAIDQNDTDLYVADQVRLAAAAVLAMADRVAWMEDVSAANAERNALIRSTLGRAGDAGVDERHEAHERVALLMQRCHPIHETDLGDIIGPAIKDGIEYVQPEDADDGAVSASTH